MTGGMSSRATGAGPCRPGTSVILSRCVLRTSSVLAQGCRGTVVNPHLVSVAGRHHRDGVVEVVAGDTVEVIPVQVREDHAVQCREVGGPHRRFGPTSDPQAVAEVGPLAAMEEVRVGEQAEVTQP